MGLRLWETVHAECGDFPVWDLSLHTLKMRIGELEDASLRDTLEFLWGSVVHFARISAAEASPFWGACRELVGGLADSVPNIMDAVRTEKGLPATTFTLDWQTAAENQQSELQAIMLPPLPDKNGKNKGAKEPPKKQKTPEEAKALLDEAREESVVRISASLTEPLAALQDADLHTLHPTFGRQEATTFGDLIDRLNRKKRTDDSTISSGRFAVSVAVKLKAGTPATQPDFATEDFTEDSLSDLKAVLTEVSLLYPKFVLVLLKIYDSQDRPLTQPGKAIADFLGRETELKIVQENGPFIAEFEDKMENNFFEDGSFVMVGNVWSHPALCKTVVDQSGLTWSKMWSEISASVRQLCAQTNAFVEADADGFFEYDPFASGLKVEERLFGGRVKAALDIIRGFFCVEKTPKPRQLILGGAFTPEKVWMACNTLQYFTKITLAGDLGLLWGVWKLDAHTPLLTAAQKGMFQHLDALAGHCGKKVGYMKRVMCAPVASAEGETNEALNATSESPFRYHDENRTKLCRYLDAGEWKFLQYASDGTFVAKIASENPEEEPITFPVLDFDPSLAPDTAKSMTEHENTLM